MIKKFTRKGNDRQKEMNKTGWFLFVYSKTIFVENFGNQILIKILYFDIMKEISS